MSRVLILQGSPRRRSPSPTGKVDRAQPGPDEGKQPKSEKTGHVERKCSPFNVACLVIGVRPLIRHALRRATFPVGEGCLPAGVFPYLPRGGRLPPGGGVPSPSPWGKAASRRGSSLTFPVGEGFLRRGRFLTFPWGKATSRRGVLTFPWGKVPPQRRKRGGTKSVLRAAPHPSRLRRATLSQERVGGSPHPEKAGPPSESTEGGDSAGEGGGQLT